MRVLIKRIEMYAEIFECSHFGPKSSHRTWFKQSEMENIKIFQWGKNERLKINTYQYIRLNRLKFLNNRVEKAKEKVLLLSHCTLIYVRKKTFFIFIMYAIYNAPLSLENGKWRTSQ